MTSGRYSSWHAAKFSGACALCRDPVITGDTVLTTQSPRRTVCRACGKRLEMRDAHAREAEREASGHAHKVDPHEKDE